jgi:hypothetical protein
MGDALHTNLIGLQMATLGRKRSLAKGSSGKRIMFRERTAGHFPGSALSRVFQPLQISSSHVRHANRLLPSSHSWRLKANLKTRKAAWVGRLSTVGQHQRSYW